MARAGSRNMLNMDNYNTFYLQWRSDCINYLPVVGKRPPRGKPANPAYRIAVSLEKHRHRNHLVPLMPSGRPKLHLTGSNPENPAYCIAFPLEKQRHRNHLVPLVPSGGPKLHLTGSNPENPAYCIAFPLEKQRHRNHLVPLVPSPPKKFG